MRRFAVRPAIPPPTQAKLTEKTEEILRGPVGVERSNRARDIFNASRPTMWFAPIINVLRELSGQGELCMYCSSNEPSQVEHYRPLDVFPERALQYENYLWVCDICNRSYKGNKFPPNNHPGHKFSIQSMMTCGSTSSLTTPLVDYFIVSIRKQMNIAPGVLALAKLLE